MQSLDDPWRSEAFTPYICAVSGRPSADLLKGKPRCTIGWKLRHNECKEIATLATSEVYSTEYKPGVSDVPLLGKGFLELEEAKRYPSPDTAPYSSRLRHVRIWSRSVSERQFWALAMHPSRYAVLIPCHIDALALSGKMSRNFTSRHAIPPDAPLRATRSIEAWGSRYIHVSYEVRMRTNRKRWAYICS